MALRPSIQKIKSIGTKSTTSVSGGENSLAPFYIYASMILLLGIYFYANRPKSDPAGK
jgi:hypothetical protein